MKNLIITTFFTYFSFILAFSQAPQAFNYQGLAANSVNGSPIRNKTISIEASILVGSLDSDNIIYTETHQVQTDRFGFFSITIGEGQIIEGEFNIIDWGADDHFLQIGIDKNGGSNFSILGKTQLLSVPYALHAGNGSKWEETNEGIKYEPVSINKQNDGRIEINGDQGIPELQNFETILSTKVDNGNSNDYLAIINATKLANQFIPSIQGHHTTDDRQALNLGASTTPIYDVQSSTPLMTFSSRIRSGTQTSNVQNRLLFGWQNRLETKMILSAQGNLGLGIGTRIPSAKLEVAEGDIYISDVAKGVIMKSPNGNCWRMTVSDTGQPIFTEINCP